MHSAVVYQPSFSDRGFSGLNPYALGLCHDARHQAHLHRADQGGRGLVPRYRRATARLHGRARQAWADFRDESFILQYLSPKVIRDFRMFHLRDQSDRPGDARGGRSTTSRAIATCAACSARQYDVSQQDPDIQVTDADLSGSRRLVLTHFVRDGILLDKDECDRTLMHVARLWGFRVRLVEVDAMTGAKLREHETLPLP